MLNILVIQKELMKTMKGDKIIQQRGKDKPFRGPY